MPGYLSIILHAHLPFVRHPEHEKFLEESWLFEAITESYLPLLQVMNGWQRDGMDARLTMTLSPTLCAMLRDPLLQDRYARHLDSLIELAEKEIHRTHWDTAFQELAGMYHQRFNAARETYLASAARSGRRIPPAAGPGQTGDHHHRRHARPAAADGESSARPSARKSSSPAIITEIVSAAIRAASGCPNAPTSRAWKRFCRRRTFAGSSWIPMDCFTRIRVRATACSRPSSPRTASRSSGATWNPRARSGAAPRVIPATRATAISIATSASIWISTT